MDMTYLFSKTQQIGQTQISFGRVSAQRGISMDEQKTDTMYHEQMERELRILERQNPKLMENDRASSQFASRKTKVVDDLRSLTERIKIQSYDHVNMEDFSILDTSGTGCLKNMKNNNEDNVFNNLSAEEQLKRVQREFQLSRDNALVSDKDVIIQNLTKNHSACFFGATAAWNSLAFKEFQIFCLQNAELSLEKQIFTNKLKNVHIQIEMIPDKFKDRHIIICGVEDIHLSHSQTHTLTQYLPFLCFDENKSIDLTERLHTDL